MRLICAILFSSIAFASVQLPVEPTLTCTGTGASTTCSSGTQTVTVNFGTVGSDPNVYLHAQFNNLEFENLITVDTKATFSNTSAITITGTTTGIANGQIIVCASCPSGAGNWVTVASHSGTSVTASSAPCPTCGSQTQAMQFMTATPEGSVQINSNTAINLTSANIVWDSGVDGCNTGGGLGGAIDTCWGTITIPKTQFNSGTSNTITWKILTTDGNTSNYRILAFNAYQNNVSGSGACAAPFTDYNGNPVAGCNQLISSSQFVQWNINTPDAQLANAPFAAVNNPTGIANGKSIFSTATLSIPAIGGGSSTAITAHCSSCHFANGTHATSAAGGDLYYFNYSPISILTRGMFHGLTQTQSAEIAVYIRSLTSPNPGAPWSLVYQPGPGLDEADVNNWAAGVGGITVNGLVSSTDDMVRYIAPTGTALDFDPNATPHQHEIPIPFQVLTWNKWLPRTYPGDAPSVSFATSAMLSDYNTLAGALIPNNPSNYAANAGTFTTFDNDEVDFCTNTMQATYQGGNFTLWTAAQANYIYSCSQWMAAKQFELNNVYGLQGEASSVGFPAGINRAWLTQRTFFTSMSINHIPHPTAGILNATDDAFEMASYTWYQIAILLNLGYKTYACTVPIDTGYFYGFLNGQSNRSGGAVFGYEMYQHQLFAQMMNNGNNPGPPAGCGGYLYDPIAPDQFSNPSGPFMMTGTNLPSGQITSLYDSFLKQLYNVNKAWTPSQWYLSSNNGCAGLGGTYSCFGPADPVHPGYWFAGTGWNSGLSTGLSSLYSYWIPRVAYWGTNSATVQNWINYASSLFPNNGYNWWGLLSATCSSTPTTDPTCSSDSGTNTNTTLSANTSGGTFNVAVAPNSGFVNGKKVSVGAGTAHPEVCTLNSGAGTGTFNLTCAQTHLSGDLVSYAPGLSSPTAPSTIYIEPPVSFVTNLALAGTTVQFTAGPGFFTGSDAWSVIAGPGSINPSTGLYTAPGSPPATTALVTVQDIRNGHTATYNFYVKGLAYQL